MTSPIEDTFRRTAEIQWRQNRQIQSGRVVAIDRTSLPWTLTVEFVTAHNEKYQVEGISVDPVFAFPDSGAIFVLPRNSGNGTEDNTQAPVIAVEVSRGESDEAASITGFHADYNLPEGFGLAQLVHSMFPGGSIRYFKGLDDNFVIEPFEFAWTNDDPNTATVGLNAGLTPKEGSANITGKEVNLFAGKPGAVQETAIRVWIEALEDGGRVNIMYGLDPDVTRVRARHVADIPLVHPSAVDATSGKIRTEPADPAVTDGSSPSQTASAPGPQSHEHSNPHTHEMAEHFHQIPILAVRPIRIWYADQP